MSTLSKTFVILVFLASVAYVAVQVTLYSLRVDFKDKWIKEVNYHYQTQQVKNSEIAALRVEMDNRKSILDALHQKIGVMEAELAGRSRLLTEVQRQLDSSNQLLAKSAANQGVLVRQLEVQQAQIADMESKKEAYRVKWVKANNEYSTALQELQYARQEGERLSRDLAELESKAVELAREKKRHEETLAALAASGVRTDLVGPRKKLEGKVTAVSAQFKLVVINIGKEQGVLEGDEFTIYRGGSFVAKIQVERVDRSWAAGRIVLQKDDPKVADSVSNDILVSGAKSEGGN